MNLPPPDSTPNVDLSPDGRTPWPRWLKIALVVGGVGAAAAIIAVVATNGSDSGKTASTTNTADQTTSVGGSTGSSSTVSGTTTTVVGAPTTTSAAGSQPTTSTASTAAPATAPVSSATTLATASTTPATTRIDLGSAANFGVLGNSAVDSKGKTSVNGQVGASNGSVTGFTAGDPSGVIVVDSLTAEQGQVDAQRVSAELDALSRTPLDSAELANQTISPGTYGSTTLGVTGTVTLDAGGDANARFVFESSSTLDVAAASEIVLAGGAQACNVFWRLGGSVTFGSGASFAGNVIADDSITAANGAAFAGRLIAVNGAVTLDTNAIDVGTCS